MSFMPENLKASLMIVCPDQAGVVSGLSDFFAQRQISVSRWVQFCDEKTLFARLEWTLDDHWQEPQAFIDEFESWSFSMSANFSVRFSNQTSSVGLFVGSELHVLKEFLKQTAEAGDVRVQIPFIVGSDERARTVADRFGVPFFYVEVDSSSIDLRTNFEKKLLDIISRYEPDYLALVNYDTLLSPELKNKINCPIIKMQRTFMPSFEGPTALQQAHQRGVRVVGATAFFVSAASQLGPIICQDIVKLHGDYSLASLVSKSYQVERSVFIEAISQVVEHKTIIHQRRAISFS